MDELKLPERPDEGPSHDYWGVKSVLGRWLWVFRTAAGLAVVVAVVHRHEYRERLLDTSAPGYDYHSAKWGYYHSMDASFHIGIALLLVFFVVALISSMGRMPLAAVFDAVCWLAAAAWVFDTFMTQALGFT